MILCDEKYRYQYLDDYTSYNLIYAQEVLIYKIKDSVASGI